MATILLALACAGTSASARAETLYEGLGGQPAIDRTASLLVERCLADKRIASDFQDTNLARLRSRLADFICVVADGPCVYRGREMGASHKGLHVTEARFNALVEDLEAAMDEARVPYGAQNALLSRLAPMQRVIVTR